MSEKKESSLAAAWHCNTDANLFLLDHLTEKSLANRYSPRTARGTDLLDTAVTNGHIEVL